MDFIPVNEPLLDGNEKRYLNECIDSGWISSEGSFVERLENEFAERCGRKYGIAVSNGSVALDLAVTALEIGPGDEVILPSFTIISCAASIVRAGATPVVIDCHTRTWNMDITKIESRITSKTKAIMAVHIYGLPVDMDPLLALSEKYGLRVIEDAAEAHGLTYKGAPCGSFGDVSTFSFYPNKLVTTGEGGILVTDDKGISEKCQSLRNLCFQKEKRFVHDNLGWNYRLSNVQAALGVAQLERLDSFIEKKRKMGKCYNELLKDIEHIQLPLSSTDYADNIYWVYGLVIDKDAGVTADAAMRKLSESGIGTRPFFWPMNQQPVFRRLGFFDNDLCPAAEFISRNGFYLPSGLALTEYQIEIVVNGVRRMAAEI